MFEGWIYTPGMSIGSLNAFWSHKGKGSEGRPVEAMLALKSWPHRGLRSLVYRVSKSLLNLLNLVLAMEVWAKWYCIEQFQFKLCEQIYQVIAKNWLNYLVHFDLFLVKSCCIYWAKALHLWPMRRAIGKASLIDAAKWRGYSLNICWPLQKLKYQDPASFRSRAIKVPLA